MLEWDEGLTASLIRWIALLPLLAAIAHAAMIGLLRTQLAPRMVWLVSIAAVAVSFVLSAASIFDLVGSDVTPLARVPGFLAVALMVPFHAILHIPLVSMSGQAVVTMPIMAPLCDLLGRSRDAAVLAYQTGAGLMDMLTPSNGALLAMLLSARVSYGRWLKFAVPGALLVAIVGLIGIALAG